MRALIIRGMDEQMYSTVKRISKNEHMSMNKFILNVLKRVIGQSSKKPINKGLDQFVGSWSKEDNKDFLRQISPLKKIDKELWS